MIVYFFCEIPIGFRFAKEYGGYSAEIHLPRKSIAVLFGWGKLPIFILR